MTPAQQLSGALLADPIWPVRKEAAALLLAQAAEIERLNALCLVPLTHRSPIMQFELRWFRPPYQHESQTDRLQFRERDDETREPWTEWKDVPLFIGKEPDHA